MGGAKLKPAASKDLARCPGTAQETTMNPESTICCAWIYYDGIRQGLDLRRDTDQLVNTLMGKKAELRFGYIRDHAEEIVAELDV